MAGKIGLAMPNVALIILRLVFLLVAMLLGIFFIKFTPGLVHPPWMQWVVLGGVVLIALAVIAADVLIPRKHLDTISAVYFGLIVGLFLTYVASLGLEGLPIRDDLAQSVRLVLGMVLCYGCISLLLQTKNDFRFIIPYV